MTLYEEMKNGTSAEDLLRQFTQELKEAKDRLRQEEAAAAAERDKFLAETRKHLSEYLVIYMQILFGEECDISTEEVEGFFITFEEHLEDLIELDEKLHEAMQQADTKEEEESLQKIKHTIDPAAFQKVEFASKGIDDRILRNFLKTLK